MALLAIMPAAPQLVALIAIGLLAGVLGGLLGVGGGLVMIPSMLLVLGEGAYGPNSMHLYKLAALTTAVLLSLPAIRQHVRAGALQVHWVAGIVPGGLAGVAAGVLLGAVFADEQTHILRRVFGAFMIASVAASLWFPKRADAAAADPPASASTWRRLLGAVLVVGLPSGVIAGLLGVGGGIWAVPAQHLILGLPLRTAIANSAGMILALTLTAAVGQGWSVSGMAGLSASDGLWLAVWLAPGALAGGWIGASLTHRLPVERVRRVFHVVLVLTGLRLLFG